MRELAAGAVEEQRVRPMSLAPHDFQRRLGFPGCRHAPEVENAVKRGAPRGKGRLDLVEKFRSVHVAGRRANEVEDFALGLKVRPVPGLNHVGFEIAPPAQQLRFCELAGNAVRLEPVECLEGLDGCFGVRAKVAVGSALVEAKTREQRLEGLRLASVEPVVAAASARRFCAAREVGAGDDWLRQRSVLEIVHPAHLILADDLELHLVALELQACQRLRDVDRDVERLALPAVLAGGAALATKDGADSTQVLAFQNCRGVARRRARNCASLVYKHVELVRFVRHLIRIAVLENSEDGLRLGPLRLATLQGVVDVADCLRIEGVGGEELLLRRWV
mmetsp:Transcript_10481/g.22260  ORF Transcript_10481/g.22260 Transcript_10481/m.22260 type:complete len:334 (-) Transcript_10481:534-1535(-)